MRNIERMPPLAPDAMTPEQRVAASEIAAGRRGALSGPFVPALRSPEFMRRLQRLGEYLRYDAALPPPLREMVILLTARSHRQSYEWSVHEPIARREGLSSSIIAALEAGRRPDGMTPDETIVFELFAELQSTHDVTDATYTAAVERFGERGVIDLVGLVGYYGTLALVMNATRVRGA
jgi:4-carboxymuconolactone decarboxylase